MSSTPAAHSTMELKYCERCGGLCLRPRSARQIYCRACATRMRRLPPPDGLSVRQTNGPPVPDDSFQAEALPVAWASATGRPTDRPAAEARCSR